MGKEIERKFLVTDDSYLQKAVAKYVISQGYLSVDPDRTVRVRVKDNQGFITVKSRNVGAVRSEWEYEIPVEEALEMQRQCCTSVLSKVRYIVPWYGKTWEVDAFNGRHDGLVLAEVELTEEFEPFRKPPFVGLEVTGDPRYYNSNLGKE